MAAAVSRPNELIPAFHPEVQSEQYNQYFRWFLESTNQKEVAWIWLKELLRKIPERNAFIDVGAGRGDLLKVLSPYFLRCIGIEPSSQMANDLANTHPNVELHATNILGADLEPQIANLALMSHVKYYIPTHEWQINTDRVITWLAPGGLLVEILQNPFSDFQKMITTFLGPESACNLQDWAFNYAAKRKLTISLDCREAWVEQISLERMLGVAIFMMNNAVPGRLTNHPDRPSRAELATWIEQNYRTSNGYRMSCRQDFVVYVVPKNPPEQRG